MRGSGHLWQANVHGIHLLMAMYFIHLFNMAEYQAGNYRDITQRYDLT